MSFKDYFSQQTDNYVRYRPRYQQELVEYLSSLVESHETAWDCGTGNGQIALDLVKYFAHVYASDASSGQIANAIRHERINYLVALAESTPFLSDSIDLITVAQAFHWFDADGFFTEAKRVLKPQGVLAISCYGLFDLPEASEALKSALKEFYEEIEPFWPPERQLIRDEYKTIVFPFEEIQTPAFFMTAEWEAEHLLGYLRTWSSTQKYIAERGEEEILLRFREIAKQWGSPQTCRQIYWPIHMRVGRL